MSISLKYYGQAHTDGDISIRFGEADILHVADTFWIGIYPFIDYSTGGSIDGMIGASGANLAATTEKTIIDRLIASRSPVSKSPRIPRMEANFRRPRRRRPQRFARHSGQRRSDQSLPGREASVSGRRNHSPARLELRPLGGKQQSLWPSAIFRSRST